MIDIIESKKISSRDLNPRQRRKVRTIVRWFRERNNYSGVTSIRFELVNYGGLIWITLITRRSDCGKYSPRQIICEQRLHAKIGPRGGLMITSARSGTRSELSWIRRYL